MTDTINKAIEAIEQIRHKIWEVDIPSPTVPEYVEHHEQMIELMRFCDEQIAKLAASEKSARWLWQAEVRCSNCNYKLQQTGLPSRCPNCDAWMMGEEWRR